MKASSSGGVGLLLAAIGVLSGCTGGDPMPSAAPSPATASPAPSANSCPAGVTITAGPVEAAMGLRAMRVNLLNCGTKPYVVQGYPALRVLDDKRRPLGVTVLDGTEAISKIEAFSGPARRVTAAPGQRLAAVVVWRNTVTDTSVPATTARRLEIAPAGGQPPQTVTPNGGIDIGTTGRLAVSAWTRPPAS